MEIRILADQFLPNPDRWGISAFIKDDDGNCFEATLTIERGDDATLADLTGEIERRYRASEIPKLAPINAA